MMNKNLKLYLQEISKYPILTRDEEVLLVKKMQAGDESAMQKLIQSNLRFVVSVAKSYRGLPIPLDDLIAAGNIGLIAAIQRFDDTRGYKLISYAVHWIKQAILFAAASQSRIVRLPINQTNLIMKINKTIDALEKEKNHEAKLEDIAAYLEEEESKVRDIFPISRYPHLSLDEPISEDGERTLMHIIPHKNGIENEFINSERTEKIDEMLSTLSKREAEVIRLYYGIGKEKEFTLEEIGKMLNLSRERVRQIKRRGLNRLRHHSRKNRLKEYI